MADPTPQATPGKKRMARLALIHGIGQQNFDSGDPLLAEWTDALARGDAGLDLTELRTQSEMVFYGNVFRESGAMGDDDDLDEWDDESLAFAEELARVWIERAAQADDPKLRADGIEALEEITPAPQDAEAMGPLGLVRRAVAAAAGIRYFAYLGYGAASWVVNRDLRQVTAYMKNRAGCRDTIRTLAEQAIGPETSVVVAHSLGSVVAYEALQRTSHHIDLFVTIGSPLGLETIIYPNLDPSAGYPLSVSHWVNVADTDDIVAADPSLAERFTPPPGRRLEDRVVDNGREWHLAAAYLDHVEVAVPIREALRSGR